jgi:hypothetical protein
MTPEMLAVAQAIEVCETAADASLAECERLAMPPRSVKDILALGSNVLKLHADTKAIEFGDDWFSTHADVAMLLGNRLQAALMHMYRAGAHMRDANMAVGQMHSCHAFHQWEPLFICSYLAASTMRFALEQLHSAFDLVAGAYEIAEKEHARTMLVLPDHVRASLN